MLVCSVKFLDVKVIELHQVLLEFRLTQEVADSEIHNVFSVILRGSHQLDLVVEKLNLRLRLSEVACDGWLETLGVHVSLEIKTFLIVCIHFLQVCGLKPGLRGLELSKLRSLKVADLS